MIRLIPLCVSFLVLFGCTKPSDYFYIHPTPMHVDRTVPIKEMTGTNELDILWVIDNSGSMGTHQQDVINNMNVFITALAANTTLNWKSGLISTDISDQPYAGFTSGTELLSGDPNVAQKFEAAVGQLGINGSGIEQTFDPVVQAMTNYPDFHRPGAAFALILISDAPEQSYNTNVTQFIQFLTGLNGNLDYTFFYGFLNPQDWCIPTDDPWTWMGSPFQILNTALQGQVYKLCDPNFANNLKNLGANLGQQFTASRIYLKEIPKPETIQVIYQGVVIKGGPRSSGGYWIYRPDINAIEFSDLSFAPSQNAAVEVSYDADNGVD
jgi:hypothetical protein